jgi:flagellar L-ring protein precursor FlgH
MGYAALYQGHRASAVGDPVTIVLTERITTSKAKPDRKAARSGGFRITPPATGPLSFIKPDSLKMSGETSFKGEGNANQTSTLGGEVSVTIVEVRPNGTALVRGEKRLMLSQGTGMGPVRRDRAAGRYRFRQPDRLDPGCRCAHRICRQRPVSRASREGWLSKFFNFISPF